MKEEIINKLKEKIIYSSNNSLTENEVSKNIAIQELIEDLKDVEFKTTINIHTPSEIKNLNKNKDTTGFGAEKEFIVASDRVYDILSKNGIFDDSPFVDYSLNLLNNYRLYLIDYLEKEKRYIGVVDTNKDIYWNSAIEMFINKLKLENGNI